MSGQQPNKSSGQARPTRDRPIYFATEERAALIQGNAPAEIKQHVLAMLSAFLSRGKGFADAVGGRIKITEIDIRKKDEEPGKLEGRVVCDVLVEEGEYAKTRIFNILSDNYVLYY